MPNGTITRQQLKGRAPGSDRSRRVSDLPHPSGLPIVGNGHQLNPETLHLQLEAWAVSQLDAWIAELVAATRAALSRNPALLEQAENLLQAMMASERADGQSYSDEQIAGNVMTMLLAGEDTTANTIAWTVHELLEHPSLLRELAQEVDENLGTLSVPTDPAVLDRLQLTGWAANEALRLRPVVPAMATTALQDVVVDGVSVAAGTHVVLLLRRLSTDPAYVTRPKEFLPSRWGDPHLGDELRLRGLYVPFGSGPRICPGRALALLELRVVLAMLFHQFCIERVGDASAVRESLAFTMAPQGLRVRLRARHRS